MRKYKVWVEFEREIEARTKDDAEYIFFRELKMRDLKINSVEVEE